MPLENEVDIWKIDWDISGLVTMLNRIPGVRTEGSCQGHIDTFYQITSTENGRSKIEYIPADPGRVFLRRGFVTFTYDEAFQEARRFKEELTQYTRRRPHIHFGIYQRAPPQIVYSLDLVFDDLIQRRGKLPRTNYIEIVKDEHQLSYQEALQRYIAWYKSLLDTVRIAEKYQRH